MDNVIYISIGTVFKKYFLSLALKKQNSKKIFFIFMEFCVAFKVVILYNLASILTSYYIFLLCVTSNLGKLVFRVYNIIKKTTRIANIIYIFLFAAILSLLHKI